MRKNKPRQPKATVAVAAKPLVVFRCLKCGVPVTRAVRPLAYQPDAKEYKVGRERVARGFYFIEGADFVLNRHDLHDTTSLPDMGCCGQCGRIVNVLCAAGHPVATEFADCCTAHYVELHDSLVRAVPQAGE